MGVYYQVVGTLFYLGVFQADLISSRTRHRKCGTNFLLLKQSVVCDMNFWFNASGRCFDFYPFFFWCEKVLNSFSSMSQYGIMAIK